MRVIEPRRHFSAKTKKKPWYSKRRHLVLGCLALVIGGYILFGQRVTLQRNSEDQTDQSSNSTPANEEPKRLKTFTGEEFKNLYSSFVYPNTQPLEEPPTITGNKAADERIRQLAEARGYQLTAIPVASIVKIDEPGLTEDDLIQPYALIAWRDMKQAAAAEGIPLQITSAYRSIEFQRSLFMQRLANAGISVFGIADGYSDEAVTRVLSQAAMPGYSRHHTGYTIDLACNGVGLYAFKSTSCYTWLSKDNFANAKRFGWVPSYPEEAEQQGPAPEPWEYIWVGTDALYE